MTDTPKTKLVTPEGMLTWAWLFKPREGKKGRGPKYMTDIVFSPAALQTPEWAAMKQAAAAAAAEKFGDRLQGLITAEKFISPFWKNERKIDAATGKLPKGYEPGGMYITIKSQQRPGFRVTAPGGGLVPLTDENDIYPGCIVRASVDVWAYDDESKGVSFGLWNILKVRDGDPLVEGRGNPDDDFSAFGKPVAAGAGATPNPAASAAASLFG